MRNRRSQFCKLQNDTRVEDGGPACWEWALPEELAALGGWPPGRPWQVGMCVSMARGPRGLALVLLWGVMR